MTNMTTQNRQRMYVYSIRELIDMMNNNFVQIREVSQPQVREIRNYLLENAMSRHIYFPPLVASVDKLNSEKPMKLKIIDGNKRIQALFQLPKLIDQQLKSSDDEMEKAVTIDYLLNETSFAIQVIEGLSQAECDQLYIDFNTRGKKVSLSKRIAYDSRNEINQITNLVLVQNIELKNAGIELEKQAMIKPANKKMLSLSQLRQLVAVFITGDYNTEIKAIELKGELSKQEYVNLMNLWFDKLFQLHPSQSIGNYEQTMLASFPMLLAIACYVNKNVIYKGLNERKKVIMERMERLINVNWEPKSEAWSQFKGRRDKNNFFYFAKDRKTINELVEWLERG